MEEAIDLGALRDSVAEVLADQATPEIVLRHHAQAQGRLDALWATATELGWATLSLAEDHGGLGLGIDALVPIYEVMGRAAPLPYLATMLAAQAIGTCGTSQQSEIWLTRIAEGAPAAVSDPVGVGTASFSITTDGDGRRLSGTIPAVLDADGAALIVVLARSKDGSLHRVILTPDEPIRIEPLELWDHGHTLAAIHADDVIIPADRVMHTDEEHEAALFAHAAIGLAAEALGGADAILEQTIAFLGTRQQFGQPVGKFQALKHRVADHRTRTVAGRALVEAAARGLAAGDVMGMREAHAAKALLCADYVNLTRDCVQLHGGMGFTAEQPVHLYLKRALLNAALFGGEGVHLEHAAALPFAQGAA